jgi:hypothetical protein
MKRIHPNLGEAAVFAAAIWFASAAGCRSQSGTMPSPFLAPDRVPPPATRALMPGQAQPYYPGDPLPVMQSSAARPAAAILPANVVPSSQSTADTGLAWSAPRTVASGARSNDSPSSTQLAHSNEPAVAVPTDGDSLRISLPVDDQTTNPHSIAASPGGPQQTVQLAAAPPSQTVLQASFNAPVASSSSSADATAVVVSAAPPQSPWRPPRIAPSAASQFAAPLSPAVSVESQWANQPNTIDVRMRAVPSPPEPAGQTAPRIRLPGYSAPLNASNSIVQPTQFSSTVSSAVYTAGPQIHPLPASYVAASGPAAMPGAPASPDGFRARGSRLR